MSKHTSHPLTASPWPRKVSLQAFTGLLDNRVLAEFVIDNGSSIVAMHRSVWEKLGTALSTDSILRMQSSNSSVAATTGLLRNFPITIGHLTFYCQVQVSDDLPCKVLLGRPFYTYAKSVTIDYPDSSMDVQMTCPNTGQKILVPTYEKARESRRVASDF